MEYQNQREPWDDPKVTIADDFFLNVEEEKEEDEKQDRILDQHFWSILINNSAWNAIIMKVYVWVLDGLP